MGVPSPPSSPRRAGAAPHSTSSTSIGLVLAGVACLAAVAVGSFGLTTEATLGIDLGTTFSVAATCERGIVTVVRVPGGSGTRDAETMPSVVYFPERAAEAAVVGADAAMRRATHPRRVVYDAKRIIGRRVDDPAVAEETKHLPFAVVDNGDGFAAIEMSTNEHEPKSRHTNHTNTRLIAPEEVGAMILARLKRVAERGDGGAVSVWKSRLGFRFRTVTVSVPVNFSKEQKAATLRAARSAGFTVARLLEEPGAAAVAHGLLEKNEKDARKEKTDENDGGKLVLVYDMGGGTLDVSLLHLSNGIFEVMAAAGDNRLGGQDFNLLLLDHLLRQLKQRLPKLDVTADPEAMRALREEAERLKVEMNDECDCAGHFYDGDVGASVEVRLPPALAAAAPLVVTRAEYEAVAAPLFERALAPVRSVLGRVEMPPKDVDELVLVGGSTRMAKVRALLRDFFDGREPNCAVSPEEAVAHGTAIQAAILTDRKKIAVGATEAALHQHIEGGVER